MPARLEHVNFTVSDPKKTADLMCDLFGWKIRWEGPSSVGGYTYHVGEENTYLAIYSEGDPSKSPLSRYQQKAGLNHIGVVVDDIDATEARVRELGYRPHAHGDYEPGRRFYFSDEDEVEYEVVSYS